METFKYIQKAADRGKGRPAPPNFGKYRTWKACLSSFRQPPRSSSVRTPLSCPPAVLDTAASLSALKHWLPLASGTQKPLAPFPFRPFSLAPCLQHCPSEASTCWGAQRLTCAFFLVACLTRVLSAKHPPCAGASKGRDHPLMPVSLWSFSLGALTSSWAPGC